MAEEIIRTEIVKVLSRAYPPVIMTLEDIADTLSLSYNYVRNEVQHQPSFPPKLDRFKQPRWSREAILAWAQVI